MKTFSTALIMSFNPRRRLALAVLVVAAGCRNPQADALIAEQMRDINDELNAARLESSEVRNAVDSLRTVVAKQDTLLRQLAGMANVPVPPR